jgi:demethylmenaquinone methyltransferase/2-methoxy-6-polyprenyl-1,4-benzoquinol methylase
VDRLLREQAAYYREHAADYDLVYESRPELRSLDTLADGLPIAGSVLELACGTGQWTRLLAARGHPVTAVDGAPEMLQRARDRVGDLDVEFVQADLFSWQPPRTFDTVFFGFWLSHVPPSHFAAFWSLVRGAVGPGGRVCFVDSGPGDAAGENVSGIIANRPLCEGGTRRIVKVFRDPGSLARELHDLGWSARVWPVGATLLAGHAEPV